jgi:SAM-dependent methyltransferase
MERVLQHVPDPASLVLEAARCLQPGGLLTLFEPDWRAFRVESDVTAPEAGWLAGAQHPAVGADLWWLTEQAGCEVMDRVEELSVWRSLRLVGQLAGLAVAVESAVKAGRVRPEEAERWLAHQREREAEGRFRATLPKILIVAQKR